MAQRLFCFEIKTFIKILTLHRINTYNNTLLLLLLLLFDLLLKKELRFEFLHFVKPENAKKKLDTKTTLC